ncbi:MAG: hypothetical protein ACYC5A_09435 [Thermoleophilia bacterium]
MTKKVENNDYLKENNDYLNIVLGNLADKVARYGLYVERIKKQAEEERIEPAILQNYESYYKNLRVAVGNLYSDKFEHTEQLGDSDFIYWCLERSSGIWKNIFMPANDLLRHAPTPWARPELFALLKEFQKETSPNLTIVLTDEYSYLWSPERNIQNDPRVVKLPKIEKDDPLFWALLFHEIGHELDYRYGIAQDALKKYSETSDRTSYELSINWVEEIFSDLYGLRILGPSYYAAFLSHVLSKVPIRSQWDTLDDKSHPPIGIRTRCMEIALEHETKETTGWDLKELKRFVDIHETILGLRKDDAVFKLSADMGYEGGDSDKEIKELFCRPLVKAVLSASADKYESLSFGNETLGKEVSYCSHRLEKLRPACAMPMADSDSLEEQPCSIETIVNAAWRCKTSSHPKLYANYFREDYKNADGDAYDWPEAFRNISKYLHNFDRLVLSSLGVANVHKFYKEYIDKNREGVIRL